MVYLHSMKAKDQQTESPNKKKKKSSSDLTTSLEKRKVLPSPRKRETVKKNKKNVTTIETSDGRHRKKDVTSIKPRKKKTRNPTKEITEEAEAKKKRDITVESSKEVVNVTAIQTAAFETFAKVIFTMGIDGLIKEYNEHLKPYVSCPFKRDAFDQNASKNRYKDVVCNGYTRVILNDGKGSDYIHANYIRGEPLICSYICTQGPLPSTIVDFWRMVWLEKTSHIVMLCSVLECGKRKCEQYWPEDNGTSLTFDGRTLDDHMIKSTEWIIEGIIHGNLDFSITSIRVNNSDPHVTRATLEVKLGKEKHYLKHHRWKTWPDKTVPKSLLAVFRILHQTRRSKTPIVVHCSAGIGRTGSFVAIEMGLQRLLSGNLLNLLEICKRLRDQRMHSVQVEIQYIYVAVALCDYGRAMKYIVDPALLKEFDRFKDTFNAYVATLGMDDMPPPAPAPLPIPGFPAPASPIPLPSPAYSPTVPAPACAIPLPSPGYAPTAPAPPLAYPPQIPGTAYPSQAPANVYPPLPPPRAGHQVAATQYVPEQDLPP